MTKKTRLIPFDWDKYKAGAKAVCRTREYEIQFIGADSLGITVVYFHKNCYKTATLELNGRYIEGEETNYDLFLKEEIEEKTFYVNVYKEGVSEAYYGLHTAKENSLFACLGQLKVTYTDEDLIK